MNKKHIGSNFDDWLKEEGIEISERDIIKRLKAENEELKQALEDVREIAKLRLAPYMTFGTTEYIEVIRDIQKIVNEVLKDVH